MFKDLTYKKKNQLLLAAALLIAVLSWFLALQETWDAYRLNARLHEQVSGPRNISESPGYTSRRLEAINVAYNMFKVDSASWRNELWLRVSGIAPSDKYQLVYNSEAEAETAAITDSLILSQNIRVRGQFRDLIQLLRSAEGMQGIGHVSSLKLSKPKEGSLDTDPRLINMDIQFRAVPRSSVH